MPLQRPSSRNRFSNRQAMVFGGAVLLGLIVGAIIGRTMDGLMIGAIVGALLMLIPGIRDRQNETTTS